MFKVLANIYLYLLALCACLITLNAQANSCAAVFPSPISSSSTSSQVNFEFNAQVFGSGGSIAAGINNDATSGSNLSCDSQKCADSGQRATNITLPTFMTQSSSDSHTLSNTQSLNLVQGAYNTITMNYQSKVHFIQNNQVTYIQNLNVVNSEAEITFDEGVYWIDTFTLGFETQIKVNNTDKVILFVNNANFNQSTVKFNELGLPEQLIVVLYNSTAFGYRTTLNGFIHGNNNIITGNESVITGAINSNNITVNFETEITYASSSVDALEFENYCSARAIPEPVLDFRFDKTYWTSDAGDVLDSSSNAVNGTVVDDTAIFQEGAICRAASFDGTNDYIDATGIDNYLRTTATVSFWLKTTQTGNNTMWVAPGILGNESAGDGNDIFWGYLDASGSIRFLKGNGASVGSSGPINDNSWYHVVFSWDSDSGQSHSYINGTRSQSAITETGDVTTSFSSIGRIQDSGGNGHLNGQIDELLVFDEILTPEQISALYDEQVAGRNYDGSARICPVEAQAGKATLKNTGIQPEFTKVCFAKPFTEVPRVFSIPNSELNADRIGLRIKNVTTQGFEVAQVTSPEKKLPVADRPNGLPSQTIDFLAVVEGDYNLNNDAKMRVDSHSTVSTIGKYSPNSQTWDTLPIDDIGFDNPPAMLGFVQTMNNETDPFPVSEPFLSTAIRNIRTDRFSLGLERSETDTGSVDNNETLAYLAVTPNVQGKLNRDISFESFLSGRSITGNNTCKTIDFTQTYDLAKLLVIANKNSRNGGDGGWLGRCSITSDNVGFHVIEDRDNDLEGNHTTEEVGGLALSGSFSDNTCDTILSEIHHYRIEHDGNGLTCDAETVTIKTCMDASCSSLSPSSTNIDITLGGNVIANTTFIGSTIVNFNHTTAETLALGVTNATVAAANTFICDSGSNSSCDITFADAGFKFLSGTTNSSTIPNQTAGVPFSESVKIQAVENDNGVCSALFDGDQTVKLSQENVNPSGTSGLNFQVSGTSIAKHTSSSSGTNITLNFGANSIATIPSAVYLDAGQIRLHANYDQNDIQLTGTSNNFWVAPASLIVTAHSGTNSLNGNSAISNTIHSAAEDFNLKIVAYNGATPAAITQNYEAVQPQFKLKRVLPNNAGSVDGLLTYASNESLTTTLNPVFQNVNSTSFTNGTYNFNNANYSEVGVVELEVKDNNYGNQGIEVASTPTTIGRFTPHYLKQEMLQAGTLMASCGANTDFSAYSGQRNETNNSEGAIKYLTNPIFKITAYNKQDQITQNYYQDSEGSANDFMKLQATSMNILAPSQDKFATGVDSTLLPVVSNTDTGVISQNDLSADSSAQLPRGVLHYQLSANDNFYYVRSSNAKVNPFQSNLEFTALTSTDDDNVPIQNTTTFIPAGIDIKFGRTNIENSFGPETHNLGLNMRIEHFNNNAFVTSNDNSCTSYDVDNFTLGSLSLDATLTHVLGTSSSFINGVTNNLLLQAPGENNTGNISITYDSFDWLKYDWDNDGALDNNPSAEATFGIYKGDERLLHWREN